VGSIDKGKGVCYKVEDMELELELVHLCRLRHVAARALSKLIAINMSDLSESSRSALPYYD
jgi:hypothetical protein